jgi:hypothetical protein
MLQLHGFPQPAAVHNCTRTCRHLWLVLAPMGQPVRRFECAAGHDAKWALLHGSEGAHLEDSRISQYIPQLLLHALLYLQNVTWRVAATLQYEQYKTVGAGSYPSWERSQLCRWAGWLTRATNTPGCPQTSAASTCCRPRPTEVVPAQPTAAPDTSFRCYDQGIPVITAAELEVQCVQV